MSTIIINDSGKLDQIIKLLKKQNKKLKEMANSIADLTKQVDDLQASLDAEQEQIKAAIEALSEQIEELEKLVVDGGTEEERQALADKLTAIKVDLEGTIPDTPPTV